MSGHFRAWGLPGDSVRKEFVAGWVWAVPILSSKEKVGEVIVLLILILCEFRRSCLSIHILLFSYLGGRDAGRGKEAGRHK